MVCYFIKLCIFACVKRATNQVQFSIHQCKPNKKYYLSLLGCYGHAESLNLIHGLWMFYSK